MISSVDKKWRLFRAWMGRHPIWTAWQVTYRCNFRCRFCQYWCEGATRAAEPPASTYADGARKLAKIGSLLVSLAGGEPLLRTDLPEIVRAVGEYHFPFITTNGWLATPESARELMRAGLWGVSVSIDYADAARHDHRRGVVGAWEQAWRAVELFSAARVHPWQRVNVIAVLLEDNIDQVEPLLEMAAQRNAYFMIQPYGQLKTGLSNFAHSDGAVSPRLVELHDRHHNFLSNRRYLGNFDAFLHGGVPGCRAGQAFFNIDEVGDVAICVERRARPVGNLYRDNIIAILDRLKAAARGNACQRCWYNCRGEVECLYNPRSLLLSLPTLFFDRGAASGKMGRW
jgi:MoaA/NifB/PqqE/SkfB family radical SAM enzyme